MKKLTLTGGVVTAIDELADSVTVETVGDDDAPRIGSTRIDGHWVSAQHAVLVDDDTGEVVQVARNKWADAQPVTDGATWVQTGQSDVVAGYVQGDDGVFDAPPPPRDIAAEVAGHALALKIGAVNAIRTDGGDPFPATTQALDAARQRYTDIINAASAAVAVGETLSNDEKATVQLIRQGFAFWQAVDAAAAAIIAAGDAADPIHTDSRWPALPNA